MNLTTLPKRIGLFCLFGILTDLVLFGLGYILAAAGTSETSLALFFPWAALFQYLNLIGGNREWLVFAVIPMPLYAFLLAVFWTKKDKLPYVVCALSILHFLATAFSVYVK